MKAEMDERKPETGIRLTEQQQRARRARSIAIAVSLGVLGVRYDEVTRNGVGTSHLP
jgi:hypothetical protein